MSGYPHNYGSGYGAPPPYGQPPPTAQPYGAPPPSSAQGYGAPAPSSAQGYGAPPPSSGQSYGAPPPSSGQAYGAPPPSSAQSPYGSSYGAPPQGSHSGYSSSEPTKPPKENKPSNSYGAPSAPYGAPSAPSAPYGAVGASPFSALVPSVFPPGCDPSIVSCFQMADQDGSGSIDDKELQRALSSYNQTFSLRTVHLLMYLFTNSNARKIGPKEFTDLFYSLQSWRGIFERFDRDRSGKIDISELREALMSLGFAVSPTVLELLVSKFDKTGGKNKAIEYDNFIECCLTVKGLTEKFKEKDVNYSGSATFTYESFMLTVLPFLIA